MSTGTDAQFMRVVRECRRWGVRVSLGSVPNIRGTYAYNTSPEFDTAVLDGGKTIVWVEENLKRNAPCALMHELGHALQSQLTGKPPSKHDEIKAMLALEQEAWTRLRLPFSAWMADFNVDLGDGGDCNWPDAPQKFRREFLRKARIAAAEQGLMKRTETGRYVPTYTVTNPWRNACQDYSSETCSSNSAVSLLHSQESTARFSSGCCTTEFRSNHSL